MIETRKAIVALIKSREGKNQYTQGPNRTKVASGYSDCSALTQWAYRQATGINIGSNTVSQIKSDKLETVPLKIADGVPDEAMMQLGDLLYFRGTDKGRKSAQYVGHVETYVGNGELSGHGGGIGPTRKNMRSYCKSRQSAKSPVPAGNRGLICVRRFKGSTDTTYKSAVVNTKSGTLNLRSEPNTTSKIIAKLSKGTIVQAKPEVNGWHEVKTNKGDGYMSAEYILMK